MNEVDKLKQDLLSKESEKILYAAKRLSDLGIDAGIEFLIPLLERKEPEIRNKAALALADLKDSRAVEPLLSAISKKDNYHFNGTLVHALSFLNCEKNLMNLFEILFYQEYEPRIGVVKILEAQEFEFSEKDLYAIQAKWNFIKNHPEKCPEFEKVKDDIENIIEGFLIYLNK